MSPPSCMAFVELHNSRQYSSWSLRFLLWKTAIIIEMWLTITLKCRYRCFIVEGLQNNTYLSQSQAFPLKLVIMNDNGMRWAFTLIANTFTGAMCALPAPLDSAPLFTMHQCKKVVIPFVYCINLKDHVKGVCILMYFPSEPCH